MRIQLESGGEANLIRTYAPGRVVVNETAYGASLIVKPDEVIADWPPQTFAHLAESHFQILAELRMEVVLIGTGASLRFPRSDLLRPLIAAGCGFEIMDTGAACRTYNILMGEGRRVAAALLMIEG
jgi:uncharacterized protein